MSIRSFTCPRKGDDLVRRFVEIVGNPHASLREAAATLYAEYDVLQEVRKRATKEMVTEAREHSISKVLGSCPGIGSIRAAQLLPIVVTPHRFRTKRQFWSYAGLGIVMRSSSDWVRDGVGKWQRAQVQQTRGLNLTHNHQLKAIFKGAATTVVMQLSEDPLHQDYERLLASGTKQEAANRITRRGCRHCDGETSCLGRRVTGRVELPMYSGNSATPGPPPRPRFYGGDFVLAILGAAIRTTLVVWVFRAGRAIALRRQV